MRSPNRIRQAVWCSVLRETLDGIDTIEKYDPPKKYYMAVSATGGTPDEIAAGLVPEYDRYITCYDKRGTRFRGEAVEGMALWIDRVPELDENGELTLKDNGEPNTPPDYTLKRILDTQKGLVARYGIIRIGDKRHG